MNISIAMCTYNGAKYLQEQLDSITAQYRLPDELIICDDCSTDKTRDLIAAFASNAPFSVKAYENWENLGSTKSFERVIGFCTGDIIVLSDQDDVWKAEKLKRIESHFTASAGDALVFSDAEIVDENLQPLGYALWDSVGFKNSERDLIRMGKAFDLFLIHMFVYGATLAFRARFKSLIVPIPNDAVDAHDSWIALLISAVADVGYIPEKLIKYRQHSAQQFGSAPQPSINKRVLSRIRPSHSAHLLKLSKQFGYALERLSNSCDKYDCNVAMSKLSAIASHLQVRGSLPTNRLRRIPFVFWELLTLRYHHFSSGVYSAVKDALL